jgi:hypothetical protein
MAFNGPLSVDYHNVAALNRAYLSLLQTNGGAGQTVRELSGPLRRRLTSLTRQQVQRLSAAPFLLFSLRERDDSMWDQILSDNESRDLLVEPFANDLDRLRSAGLGFVWQLARQNPYTLRLTCGASLHWCERIAERTFVGLLAAVSPHPDLLVIRRGDDHDLWQKLLGDGISGDTGVRRAAHMSALQTVLTRTPTSVPRSWAVAACRTRHPGLQVAEE